MKIAIVNIIVITIIIIILTQANSTFADDLPNVIHMSKNGFKPPNLTINLGDTVIFENTDTEDHWPASNIHPTHEIYPEFDPKKPIKSSESWEFKFEKAGKFTYHDHLNPHFKGFIVVKQKTDADFNQDLSTPKNITQKNILFGFTAWINRLWENIKKNLPFNKDLASQNNLNCNSYDFDCIAQKIEAITSKSSPQEASEVLQKLRDEKKVDTTIDEHQLSHRIGRQTAKSFGLEAKSFLLCPMSAFNGGCQHGFFEYTLGQTDNTKEAAEKICESMKGHYSSKDHFYCYHGVGHGVLMAKAYDLKGSLNECDKLSTLIGAEGCWQGVFMENVNAGMRKEAREGIFSTSDPLAPCNNVEEKYQYECFINHSGYLMMFYNHSFEKASQACLKANSHQKTCIHSLGLLTTNPVWQHSILGKSDNKDEVNLSLDLCDLVPQQLRKNCLIGGIDNILNNDEMNLELRALKFCQNVGGWEKSECYSQIGVNISRQVIDRNKKIELCNKVDEAFINSCLVSAGT